MPAAPVVAPTGTPPRIALPSRSIGLLALIALSVAALVSPDAFVWHPALMIIVPTIGVLFAWRSSLLAVLVLSQVALSYGLTWLLQHHDRPPEVVALVVVWSTGLAIGSGVGRKRTTPVAGRAFGEPSWLHITLAAGLVGVQGNLVLSGSLGFESQLDSGVSTPTGIAGILSTAGTVVVLMLLAVSLGSGRRVGLASLIAAVQAGVLALSGFRGASLVFLISVVAVCALTLPARSPWRRPRRLALVGVGLALVALLGFLVGAVVRDRVATERSLSSRGTQLFGAGDAVSYIAARLDLGDPLDRAVRLRDDPGLVEAVSWRFQAQAFVPRALWPDKDILNYGQRVSAAAYGMRASRSSSTITVIGDTLVNFSPAGVSVAAILVGLLLGGAERRIRAGTGLPSLVFAAGLSSFIVGQETPLILSVAGLARNILVAAALWVACDWLRNRGPAGEVQHHGERDCAEDVADAR
jgi:hypothetical protein